MVGRAFRLQLPEEPLTLLGIGEPQGLAVLALEHWRDLEEIDTLLLEQDSQCLPFLGGKGAHLLYECLHATAS